MRNRHLAAAIRRKLLRWYDLHKRQLPWRETHDPYRIWISEIMLQQTRVPSVVAFYKKFLRRFPDVKTLAAADEQSLLASWSGLGYYSRARNLLKAARLMVRQHAGCFPRNVDAAGKLPGIGGYTAPAVLSIAYGIPLPVLDGNVARVLCRLYARADDSRTARGKRRLLQRAAALLSSRRPGDFNQALMELGATICLPKQPRCDACPLRKSCRAHLRDQVEKFPPPRSKARPVARRFTAALVLDGAGRCLLVRRARAAKWMAGFWELPMREEGTPDRSPRHGKNKAEDGIRLGRLLGHVRHSITSNRLDVAVFAARMNGRALPPRAKWFSLRSIGRVPVTTITRKALRLQQW